MPDFNGGEDRVFTEWKIGYTIDGEKYTQIVTDNGYEKGDMIDIKYNPENPQEFYLDDEKSKVEVTEEEKEAEEKEEKTPFGYAAIANYNFTLNAHTCYHMTKLSVTMCGLVLIHEIHIDCVIWNFHVKLHASVSW